MPDAPVLLAGRYRLGESLGRGGMGQVFLARDETLERDVAIKEIDQSFGADGGASARRTLREARAAARINHRNVVQVYDVLQLDDRTWIVMEYVPSRSLREEIAEQGPLDTYRVARIGLELLGALRAAHRLGVEHRDVKPANVLLADDGRVLLTDFGIAAVDDDGVISRSDILVGSPHFMAPERAQGTPSGPEADLWSLGATLYAAIEGRSPFQRGSTMATLTALATEEPDPPVRAGALRPLLEGLLRKDPAARITAEDAEGLARAVIDDLPTSGDSAPGSGLAGFAAGIPAMFRIPRPRTSGARAAGAGDSGSAAGVSRPEAGAGPGPGADGGSKSGAGAEPDGVPGLKSQAGSGTKPDSVPGAMPETGDGSESEAVPGPVAPPGAEPGADPVVGESAAGQGAGSDPGPVAGAAAGAVPDPGVRDAGEPAQDTKVDAVPPAVGWGTGVRGSGVLEGSDGAGGPDRRRRGVIVAVAALAVVLVAGTVWAVTGRTGGSEVQPARSAGAPATGSTTDGGTANPMSAGPSPATSAGVAQAPTSPSPSPAPAANGRPQLPAGWVEYTDATGFSLYVPAGWKRSRKETMVYFRGDGKILGIDQTDEPKSNPVKDWQNQSRIRVANGDFPQYSEVAIKAVRYFRKAADWEFTFTRDGVRRHVNNRGTVVADDKAYGFYWETSDAGWAESRDDLQLVFDSFVPARS